MSAMLRTATIRSLRQIPSFQGHIHLTHSITRCICTSIALNANVKSPHDSAIERYKAKLAEAAKQFNYKTVDELMNAKKEQAQKEQEERKKRQESSKAETSSNSTEQETKEKTTSMKSNIPPPRSSTSLAKEGVPYKRPVSPEVFALLASESRDDVLKIWRKMFEDITGERRIAGEVTSSDYSILCEVSRQYPVFIIPLPRDEGFEFILLKFDGDTIFYTPLKEFQEKGEQARPYIIINHYTDLMESKDLVLMAGEITPDAIDMNASHAQTLAYVTFFFYVSGPSHVRELVKRFHKDPSSFNHSDVIDALTTMDKKA